MQPKRIVAVIGLGLALGLGLVSPSCTAAADDVTFQVTSALALEAPTCDPRPGVARDDVTLLDIGFDAESANGAVVALEYDLSESDAVITDAVVGLALGEARQEDIVIGTAGAAFNEQRGPPVNVLFLTPISRERAALLQEADIVTSTLRAPEDRLRVVAHITMRATQPGPLTTNEWERLPPAPQGGTLRSDEFVLPIDLCIGCLVPRCADDEIAVPVSDEGACILGQDEPFRCALR